MILTAVRRAAKIMAVQERLMWKQLNQISALFEIKFKHSERILKMVWMIFDSRIEFRENINQKCKNFSDDLQAANSRVTELILRNGT